MRTCRRARAIVLAVLAVLSLGSSPVSRPSPDAGPSPDPGPPFYVAEQPGTLRLERIDDRLVQNHRARSPADLLHTIANVGDLPGAFRSFVRDYWGLALPSKASIAGLPGSPAGTIRYGLSAGDLDGDRLADTLDVEVDFETFRVVSLTGRRGIDAKRLWTRRYGAGAEATPLPVSDVTGDRFADVLLVRFDPKDGTGAGTCAVAGCFEAGRVSYVWTITLLSGRNGSAVWNRTFAGDAAIGVAWPNTTEVIAASGTNVLVLPFLSGDHDGDGRKDIVIDALDVVVAESRTSAGTGDVWTDAEAVHPIAGTRAEVASGRSGKTIFERTQPPIAGAAFLLPASDAVGDAHPDLLWESSTSASSGQLCGGGADGGYCASIEAGRLDLEMIDGATLESSWTSSVEGGDLRYAFAIPADVDLSGDASADLFLIEVRSGLRLGVLSGVDGRVLWRRPLDPDAAVEVIGAGPPGKERGDRGHDLLVSRFEVTSQPTEEDPKAPLHVALHLNRVDGRTGRTQLVTVRTFAETRSRSIRSIESFVFGDGDGDEVADIAVNRLDTDDDINDLFSSTFVESGRTGARMWARAVPGFALTQRAGRAVGKTEGILDLRLDEDDLRSSVIDVAHGRAVWTRTEPVPDGFLSVVSPDQSGAGGDDQIFSRLMVTPRDVLSRIDGVEGRTGALHWGTGQHLPARPRGKVAGTVRNSSGRLLADMCVAAFKPDATRAGLAATTTKGTYKLGRLDTGKYRIEFYDCARTGYATRWYNQRPDFKSAHFVAVTDGRITTGVDAVLAKR